MVSLLVKLQEQQKLGYLFITHDLATLHHLAHQVAVLHRGKLVEFGPATEVLKRPKDPYTKQLIGAIPDLKPKRRPS